MKTTAQIIKTLNPSQILVNSSNYLQCVINNKFCEFQTDYHKKQWYQFQTQGTSYNPIEKFVKWIF